ncbi:MAG: hypothetical protein KDB03_03310 [Planctomycetales bacterium]|nr:hypothetical protein [Planctomycetales bacterium]
MSGIPNFANSDLRDYGLCNKVSRELSFSVRQVWVQNSGDQIAQIGVLEDPDPCTCLQVREMFAAKNEKRTVCRMTMNCEDLELPSWVKFRRGRSSLTTKLLALGFLTSFLAGFSLAVDPSTAEVKTHLDRHQVSVAEPVHLMIEVIAGSEFEVVFPKLSQGEPWGEWTVVEVEQWDDLPVPSSQSLSNHALRQWTHTYSLECYLGGEHTIPSLTIICRNKNQPAESFSLESVSHKVQVASGISEAVNPEDFRDIKSAVELARSGDRVSRSALAIAICIVALGVVAGVVLLAKRRRIKQLSPEQIALNRILQLSSWSLNDIPHCQKYYAQLIDILRQFIGMRFGVAAPQLTTEEFLRLAFNLQHWTEDQRNALQKLLERADRVKFASEALNSDAVKSSRDEVMKFIQLSKAGAVVTSSDFAK